MKGKKSLKFICKCKDAIQCRPWATPPSYRILLANLFQKYLPFWNPWDKFIWSTVFWILKIKDPFLDKKAKTYRIEAWYHFLCETIVTHIQKRYEAVEHGAFFRFRKYWKLTLLWSKNQNPVFLSFGVSAITKLLIHLLIMLHIFDIVMRIFWWIFILFQNWGGGA